MLFTAEEFCGVHHIASWCSPLAAQDSAFFGLLSNLTTLQDLKFTAILYYSMPYAPTGFMPFLKRKPLYCCSCGLWRESRDMGCIQLTITNWKSQTLVSTTHQAASPTEKLRPLVPSHPKPKLNWVLTHFRLKLSMCA